MLVRLRTTIQPMKYGAVYGEKTDRVGVRCITATCDLEINDFMCHESTYGEAEAHVAETGHQVEVVEYKD